MARELKEKHIDAYLNGIFKKLFDVIKEDPDLSFEIRMDSKTMVYCQKCKVLTINYTDTNKWEIEKLEEKYYEGKSAPSIDITSKDTLKYKKLIQKYFKEAKKLVCTYNPKPEFIMQQNIAMGNNSFDKRFLVVDMEWAFSQKGIREEERTESSTRIDLIIIDTKPNVDALHDIYLAELKVGTGALEGDSGIKGHVDKTMKLLRIERAKTAIVEDVASIIQGKTALGLIEGNPENLSLDKLNKEPKMMIIAAYRNESERIRLEEYSQESKRYASEQYGKEIEYIMFDASFTLNMDM